MTECQNVTAAWGSVCPDCHKMLPNPGPIRSWQAVRHEGADDHRRVVDATHHYRKHRNVGTYARSGRASVKGYAA
jgi:hypothetical protein